jgi:hypothetical protein
MNRRNLIIICITIFLVAALMVGCATRNQVVSQAKGTIPADSARIADEQSNKTDITSTTTTATNEKQMITQNAKADTYKGTVTHWTIYKGIGFIWSNFNYKFEVTANNGNKEIFFLRADSKVVDVNGDQIDWKKLIIKGTDVEIEYFTIADATGGVPSRNNFSREIGQKGVRVMRLLDYKATK